MHKLLLTNLLAVAIISTADESIDSRYSRSSRELVGTTAFCIRNKKRSADGLALMMSSVTSSYSADGLKEQSQESAGSLHPDARGSDVVEEISSRKLLFTSRFYLEIAISKRCRLHKLIRQRFALALKIQQEDFALIIQQSQEPVARYQLEAYV
ncbi:hypothetical protein F511_16766 [Dorcoceras hygrometricum]|uniref:Uncharacterized protein n=1 Tax=Dorcoceras hygrometricum TaxID=472368 RepID=A0A2Z7BF14_9LAMI|nr:hypothetical protein F511_16766 [Dorcoceras hygrometricum]